MIAVFFLCPVTDISATVTPIGVKFYMAVHIGPGQIFSPFGSGTPEDPQIRNFGAKFWSFVVEYLENGKSQRYMSIRAKHQLDDVRRFLTRSPASAGIANRPLVFFGIFLIFDSNTPTWSVENQLHY